MLMGAADAGARLGVDLFSVRSQRWTPIEYLDYCARLGAKLVHFSEIRFLGSLDDENLRQVRDHAKKLDISVEIGMRSCCPTSKMFDPKLGTAEEQLIRMLNAARTIGSPIVRTVLGSAADRDPIERLAEFHRLARGRDHLFASREPRGAFGIDGRSGAASVYGP